MTKWEFLEALEKKLEGCPEREVEERICFYSESIDDRIEEGISEEEAVAQIGTVDEIAKQIIADIPFTKIVKNKMSSKGKWKAGEITLLVLGAPIWLSLLIAFFAVIFSLYAVAWSVVISLWAVFVSFVACGVAGVLGLILFLVTGAASMGVLVFGGGLVCAGLAVFMFFVCKWLTKGMVLFTKGVMLRLKNRLVRKEDVQ